jgi:hypothetical protein
MRKPMVAAGVVLLGAAVLAAAGCSDGKADSSKSPKTTAKPAYEAPPANSLEPIPKPIEEKKPEPPPEPPPATPDPAPMPEPAPAPEPPKEEVPPPAPPPAPEDTPK